MNLPSNMSLVCKHRRVALGRRTLAQHCPLHPHWESPWSCQSAGANSVGLGVCPSNELPEHAGAPSPGRSWENNPRGALFLCLGISSRGEDRVCCDVCEGPSTAPAGSRHPAALHLSVCKLSAPRAPGPDTGQQWPQQECVWFVGFPIPGFSLCLLTSRAPT